MSQTMTPLTGVRSSQKSGLDARKRSRGGAAFQGHSGPATEMNDFIASGRASLSNLRIAVSVVHAFNTTLPKCKKGI